MTFAILYPLNLAHNDVQEQAKELLDTATDKVAEIKEEVIVAVEEPKKTGEAGEEPQNGEEGEQPQAAFNPETGEINWDCPCLGGMAHGPCGEEFKEAFSCFVYSETEPKGIDCIKKFEAMRTCFRQHPEHYKEELYDDDEEVPSVEGDSKPAEGVAVAVSEAAVDAIPSEGPSHATSELPSHAAAEGHNDTDLIPSEGPSHATSELESHAPATQEPPKL